MPGPCPPGAVSVEFASRSRLDDDDPGVTNPCLDAPLMQAYATRGQVAGCGVRGPPFVARWQAASIAVSIAALVSICLAAYLYAASLPHMLSKPAEYQPVAVSPQWSPLIQVVTTSMNINSSTTPCEILLQALTLDGYGASCTAAIDGNTCTFTLEYPLEPAVEIAAKAAEVKAFVDTANFTDEMAAAAANLRRRRLADPPVADVEPSTTLVKPSPNASTVADSSLVLDSAAAAGVVAASMLVLTMLIVITTLVTTGLACRRSRLACRRSRPACRRSSSCSRSSGSSLTSIPTSPPGSASPSASSDGESHVVDVDEVELGDVVDARGDGGGSGGAEEAAPDGAASTSLGRNARGKLPACARRTTAWGEPSSSPDASCEMNSRTSFSLTSSFSLNSISNPDADISLDPIHPSPPPPPPYPPPSQSVPQSRL